MPAEESSSSSSGVRGRDPVVTLFVPSDTLRHTRYTPRHHRSHPTTHLWHADLRLYDVVLRVGHVGGRDKPVPEQLRDGVRNWRHHLVEDATNIVKVSTPAVFVMMVMLMMKFRE